MKPPKRLFPKRERPGPGPGGPPGLQQWALNFADHWRAAYRAALKLGHPADIVISATPHHDDVNTPPQGFAAKTRAENSRLIPKLAVSLSKPADPGYFYVLPTKRFGHLNGSYLGMLTIPTDDEDLPAVIIQVGDTDKGVLVS